jgi:hypothetical protein
VEEENYFANNYEKKPKWKHEVLMLNSDLLFFNEYLQIFLKKEYTGKAAEKML